MLFQQQVMTNRLVPEDATGEEMIPLHFVMVWVNVVSFIILNAVVYVGDVQIPVGVHDKTCGRFLEGRNQNLPETDPYPVLLYPLIYERKPVKTLTHNSF